MKRHAASFVLVPLLVAATAACGKSSKEAGGSGPATREASSPVVPGPPAGAEDIEVQPQSYNYSPAVMDDGDVIKAWWCSASSLPGQATDQIWYQEYNKTTK
ncbi:MAG TPA: hypothetical protein VFJ85_16745, partial [Acidimicrobiales bacterium]|nr:hypothetical protein [Acidimicrobiales bacterium]